MLCAPTLVFVSTEGVGSCFHVLRARIHFRRYRGCHILFSCFARPNSFLAVPTTSGPVFMFCASGHIFGGAKGDGSRLHVLHSRTLFRRYRGSRVPLSCVALPNSFSAVPRASGPVIMFCAPELIFGVSEDVGSRFHVLRPRTRFRRYRGSRVPFSCFASPYSFSAVQRASGPVFMFCAGRLILQGTDGVVSYFLVLRARTRFRRYRLRRVPFSCFALPDTFSTVRTVTGPVFMFCAPGLFFNGTEGVRSRFHVLRSQIRFRRFRGRRVPFTCFAHPNLFSVVPRMSGPVFMFCVLVLVFGGTEGVGSHFHFFASPYTFSAVPRASSTVFIFCAPELVSAITTTSGPVFMFCEPGLIFGGTEGVGFRFHVLRS
jgi:hypothetical protein